MNDTILHLIEVETEGQIIPNFIRKKKIIKISAYINKTEIEKTIGKINETKSWLFLKNQETAKSLARLTEQQKREDSNK